MITSAFPACADDVGAIIDTMELDALQESADAAEADMPVRDTLMQIASGGLIVDENTIAEIWKRIKDGLLAQVSGTFAGVSAQLMAAALCKRLADEKNRAISIICAVSCASYLLDITAGAIEQARVLLARVAAITEAAFPVLTGLLTMTGATAAKAMLTPMSGLVSQATTDITGKWGIYLCTAACGCACAAAFGGHIRLKGIFSVVRSAVMWGSGALMTLFVAILSIQGLLGAGNDSAAMRTAQYAVDKLVPAIGKGVSDSLGTVLSSILTVKSAAGVTGMLAVLSACMSPLIRLWGVYFAIRMALAAVSPVLDDEISGAVTQFANVVSMLITICLVSVIMSLALLGAAIAAGRAAI